MKNNFIFFTILIIGLISLVSAFESQEYNFTTSVSQDGVNVNITNPIGVNVTNNSGSSSSSSSDDDDVATTSGGGGGGGGSSLLSSVVNTILGNNANQTENSESEEENENLNEEITSTNFLTGAVIGITDFAKSPTGIATFVIVGLMAVGGATFLALRKFKIVGKKENNISEQ